jgi:hypothetical protein
MEQVDTVAYVRLLARARTASQSGSWQDAVVLWEAVIASNPVDGRFWQYLAEAYYRSGAYTRAIETFERVIELGAGYPAEATYQIACCHALLGDREQALTTLDVAFARGYRHTEHAQNDPDLAALRDDARYRAIVGLIDTDTLSRDAGWRADLASLVREIKRLGYAPFRLVSEEQFDALVAEVRDTIPRLSDAQVVVELMKLLRLVNDGHTRLRDTTTLPNLRQALPVQFTLFEEGLYITAAAPQHADLLGAQVTQIASHSVDELFQALDPLTSRDNLQWLKQMIPYQLRALPILHALGLAPDHRQAALTLRDRDGQERTVTLATDESQPDIWNAIPYPAGWIFYPETLPGPLPHYLRNAGSTYWFDYLAESRTVYFQFNRVRDDPEESLAAFTARLFRFIEEHAVDRLVLDLRWNNGGNTFLELPLLHALIGSATINQRGKLFVIIGRRTFSAAQNGSSLIERHTEAIFAGEPTGASPNFVGESIPFTLPYSKLKGTISDLYWQSAWAMDYRTWIAPQLYAPPTFAAYAANRDPALDAILACGERMPGW